MLRGLDHIVHAVRDLDAAAEFYQRAGFTVGARNRHPWGTHNRIVQLDGFYFELLSVEEPEKIAPPTPRSFSFGDFNRDFLAARQGFSMLLLKSGDAAADARAFKAAGIGDFEVFDFAREGLRADGSVTKLAFSLAFAEEASSPDVRFAVCQHHFPENFWNPALQQHANGAGQMIGAVMVANDPAAHADFLKSLMGVEQLEAEMGGVVAKTPRGSLGILTPAAFRERYGVAAVAGEGARLAGLCMAVDRLEAVGEVLRGSGVSSSRLGEAVAISPDAACGATLIFEPAGKA